VLRVVERRVVLHLEPVEARLHDIRLLPHVLRPRRPAAPLVPRYSMERDIPGEEQRPSQAADVVRAPPHLLCNPQAGVQLGHQVRLVSPLLVLRPREPHGHQRPPQRPLRVDRPHPKLQSRIHRLQPPATDVHLELISELKISGLILQAYKRKAKNIANETMDFVHT
jgi:hypothetical protein